MATTAVASKFDDFLSTCLRTPGAAWTAVLGPSEYLGIKITSFRIVDTVSSSILIVDIPNISKVVATRLLDMPANDIERSKIIMTSDLDRNALWSLSLMVSQVAIRYALLEHELNGSSAPETVIPTLRLFYTLYCDIEQISTTCPPDYIVESLFSIDLCL